MQISNKTFLVSGGASGLGLACCSMIINQGGKVIIADVNEPAGQEAEKLLGASATFEWTDITSEINVKQTIDNGIARFGELNGLINCAGISLSKRVLGRDGLHPLSDFEKVIGVNLIGTFNLIRLVAQKLEENTPLDGGERGIIINTTSVAAFDGQIGQAAYAASKGGIVAMTLPLAREFARIGVRVMTIAPGTFDTPLMQNLTEEARSSLAAQVPFPSRLGKPEEFAALVKHIVENQMLNGEVIRLDGAIRMQPK